jgi:hypothetical protein
MCEMWDEEGKDKGKGEGDGMMIRLSGITEKGD